MSETAATLAQFDEIASLAEAVAAEYCPQGPIDLRPVLDDNDITISYGYYSSAFDGMLEHRSQRFHIYCNLDRVDTGDSARARFTVAHELGHFFIDDHRNALKSGAPPHGSRSEFESTLLVEREADHFASHLLMPSAQFIKVARRHGQGMAGILGIAKHFGTSVTASAIRYAKAEIVPCVVIKWSATGFQWPWISTEPFRARLRRVQKDLDKLPDDCPTRIALSGAKPPPCGYFEAGTTAACWFPYLGDSDSRNILLKEQAMQLGRFGALTFLFTAESSIA
jgi:hypothetical protein